jgi:cyclin-dependent kinase 7
MQLNFTAIREIKLLREFRHPNIIELVDCFVTPDQALCLVYECADTDLQKILLNKSIPISLADTKQHLFTLLSAVSACHSRWILHRKCCASGWWYPPLVRGNIAQPRI